MDDLEIIANLYNTHQLDGICQHLLEFVKRHRTEILAMAHKSKAKNILIDATKQLVQHRGSIHLPSEMADQIREINNEIWYRGEHADYDRSKIQEEWAMKYASMWRSFRIKEILYVADQKANEIETILRA